MVCSVLGEFNRPPIFNCVVRGLADSSLNPRFSNHTVAPLRFVVGLVVAVVSPVFAACDLLIYAGAFIALSIRGHRRWALENLHDCGILLLRFIPDAISLPFVFAYKPSLYEHYK